MKIVFDESSWKYEVNKPLNNRYFLRHALEYFKDLIYLREYIYLNQIYEHLGLGWDPDNENVCFRKGIRPFTYEFKELESGGFEITIH